MTTIKDIIVQTNFESVAQEVKIHYGCEHLQKIEDVYTKLRNMPSENNSNNMVLFIRVLKENDESNEYEVIQDFDNNDNTLMFDVCGQDNEYDGLYSIASSDYSELLGFFLEESTIKKFTFAQIVAHILWELEW